MLNLDHILRPNFEEIQLGLFTDSLVLDDGLIGLRVDKDIKKGIKTRIRRLWIYAQRINQIVTERAIREGGFKPHVLEGDPFEISRLGISFETNLLNGRIYIGNRYKIEYLEPFDIGSTERRYVFKLSSTNPISLLPVKRSEDLKATLEQLLNRNSVNLSDNNQPFQTGAGRPASHQR